MKKIIAQISKNLLEKVDSNAESYTPDELLAAGYPDILAAELDSLIRSKIEQEVSIRNKKWLDKDSAEVLMAWEQFLNTSVKNKSIPKSELENLTYETVERTLNLLMQPRKFIPEYLFAGKNELTYSEVEEFSSKTKIYPYLGLAISRYMQKRNLEEIDKLRFTELVHAIDTKKTEDYNSEDWTNLLEPLFSFCDNEVPANLLKQFLDDKNEGGLAAKFVGINDSVSRERFVEILNAPIQENLIIESEEDTEEDDSGNDAEFDSENNIKNETRSSNGDAFLVKVKAILEDTSEQTEKPELEDADLNYEDFLAELKAAIEEGEDDEPENNVEDVENSTADDDFFTELEAILNDENDSENNEDQTPNAETPANSEDLADVEGDGLNKDTNGNGALTKNEEDEHSLHELFIADDADSEDEEDDTPVIFPAASQDEMEAEPESSEERISIENEDIPEPKDNEEDINTVEDVADESEAADEETEINSLSDLVAEDNEEVGDEGADSEDEELPMWARFIQEDVDDTTQTTGKSESSDLEKNNDQHEIDINDKPEKAAQNLHDLTADDTKEPEKETSLADLYYMDDEFEDDSDAEILLEDDLIIDESVFAEQEGPDLKLYLNNKSEYFINEIFEGDYKEYYQSLNQIENFENWQDASKYIQQEIFIKRNTDLFAESTIKFLDLLQSYFKD